MEPFEKKLDWIRGARCARKYSQKHMANALGISAASYQKREAGAVPFSDEEKIAIAKIFDLSIDQINEIFFDGKLPTGNESKPSGKIKSTSENCRPPFLP